ncbi:murein transglycosylase A [Keguizhuia sedimenti]|uniref:murein transglycosylase A n=1 Tax=Keguizhuia sedimenti TaxID=3064264 RepID=UPI003BB1AC87
MVPNKFTSLILSLFCVMLGLAACTGSPVEKAPVADLPSKPAEDSKAGEILRLASFESLPGWGQDDLRDAWPAFMASCEVLNKKNDWKELCQVARDVNAKDSQAIRVFFEAFFLPYQVINPDGTETGLATGYYEPLLQGARKRGGKFQTPLHRVPEDMLVIDLAGVYPELKGMRLRGKLVGNRVVPYASRGELMQTNSLAGKEILWVDDPIEALFLQIQGSGRVQLSDTKETVRVAYADQNGHPYKSVGRYLIDKGEMKLDQASAQGIKAWAKANPTRLAELLAANPSYIFFKEEKISAFDKGPKGALGVPLTPQRSIAVDPQYIPLGVPVFLSTNWPGNSRQLERLVMAQDTGSAIKSPVRADFFWGYGQEPGEKAGKMKQRARMWVLLPRPAS